MAMRVWAVPRHPAIEASSSPAPGPGPDAPHILARMAGFTNIVVCLDDSAGALRALETARELRADDGTLTLVHVIPPPSFLTELAAGLGGGIIQDQNPLIDIAEQWIATVANDDEDSLVLEGNPTHMVAEWANDHDADVIVVARHGTPERTVLGSFTQKLIGIAPCAVLLVHAGDPEPAA
jgi:nucleotide-binding universal stress UspA family protein